MSKIVLPSFAHEAKEMAEDSENVIVINVFDPNDPNLIAIVDSNEEPVTRGTSAPTKHYDLDSKGQYNYSLTSSGSYVWTSYIFDTLDGDGSLRVKGTPTTSTKSYKVKFYNCDNGKSYIYSPTSTSGFDCYEFNISNAFKPSSFYFGIASSSSGTKVTVKGFVDTY